jgi:hypothetical protein
VILPCPLPPGVQATSLSNGAPLAPGKALKQRLGDLAPPGSEIDVSDVVVTGRNRRLIFVWTRGDRWIIATEHGGLAYNDPILAYNLSRDGRGATLVAERIAFPNTLWSTAEGLLDLNPPNR